MVSGKVVRYFLDTNNKQIKNMKFWDLFRPYRNFSRYGNNRKRTRGRQFYYAPLPNGKTRKIMKEL